MDKIKKVVPKDRKYWVLTVYDKNGNWVGYFDRDMVKHDYPTFFDTSRETPHHPNEFEFSTFDEFQYTVEYRSNRMN